MTLYEKYGLTIPLDRYLDDLEASRNPGRSVFSAQIVASSVPLARFRVAVCAYLMNDLAAAKKHAHYIGKETLDYFYGSWRSQVRTDSGTIDPNWWHGRINWMSHFSVSLCWASAVADWKTVRRLAEYPSNICIVDPTMTKEDKAAYLLLARYVRGASSQESKPDLLIISKGKKQKPKLLANVVHALQAIAPKSFQESLEAYLRYFRKSEFKRTTLDKLLCYDGTTLLNIGRWKGMPFKVPREVEDYIVRFPSVHEKQLAI